jgi:hypothetical protein
MRPRRNPTLVVVGQKVCSNKVCSTPVEEQSFGLRQSGIRKGKLRSECKSCENARSLTYKKSHSEKLKKYSKEFMKKNGIIHDESYYSNFDLSKEKYCIGTKCQSPIKTYTDFYRNKGTVDGFASVCKDCKWQREIELKQKFIEGYGGKCTCCGETEPRFLTIEHLERDGQEHRITSGGTSGMWLDIIRNNFPPKYTVLCYNCNCSQNTGRVCPHTLKRGKK